MIESETVQRLPRGWYRLKVPLPFSLRWVNAYLLPEPEGGWTALDPGLRSPETERFWETSLTGLGIGWREIRQIVVSHYHPDHYGLAGWMQRKTGAPVRLSETTRRCAERLWSEGETHSARLLDAFREHGLPDELTEAMNEHLSGVLPQVLPHPERTEPLPEPGGVFRMAGADWTLIGGEGHAPGHISFYDPAERVILCGDQVLPQITPNIGWMPGADPDPLGSYLSSLRAMLPLGEAFAYPGHRDPLPGLATRIGEIAEHHDRRLRRMAELIGEAGALNAFEMSERLFGAKIQGNAHNLRFGMAETIAHLVRLELAGVVRRSEAVREGRRLLRFRLAGDAGEGHSMTEEKRFANR